LVININFGLINAVESKTVARVTMCKLCERAVRPVATHCEETWFVNRTAEKNTNDLGKEDINEDFRTNARK
jgi:hypothetical protein